MPSRPVPRVVRMQRTGPGRFVATNDRGGRIDFGSAADGGDNDEFTPVELLLAAIGGCTALDVDALTSRRAEPRSFAVDVRASKVRDDLGNRLTDIEVTFRVGFPDSADGDAARTVLPEAVRRSHDRLCTVSRTVETGTPITNRIESP